jgi:NTP pyrophosphatase (non-canonical NTP hydrolase)
MNKLQSEIYDWQRKTFPDSNCSSMFHHLVKEIKELSNALENDNKDKVYEELADCMILLFGIAGLYRFDVESMIKAKMEINKKRKWGKPDSNGVVEHIKDNKKCEYKEIGYVKDQYPRFLYKSSCGLDVVQMERERWNGKETVDVPISGKCMKCKKDIEVVKRDNFFRG